MANTVADIAGVVARIRGQFGSDLRLALRYLAGGMQTTPRITMVVGTSLFPAPPGLNISALTVRNGGLSLTDFTFSNPSVGLITVSWPSSAITPFGVGTTVALTATPNSVGSAGGGTTTNLDVTVLRTTGLPAGTEGITLKIVEAAAGGAISPSNCVCTVIIG